LTSRSRLICASRTAVLSIWRIASGSSSASLYLLTPTITSSPRSMRACFSAAHASMRSFAQPDCTALVMPPIFSTSAMISQALAAMSCVSFSIM
jgi:hypothetical protein